MIRQQKQSLYSVYALLLFLYLTGCGEIVDYGTFHGHAMEHTIYDGDIIVIRAVEVEEITRGDIIAFQLDTQGDFTRRIIALPNETIEINDGKIFIDGIRLAEPYTDSIPENLELITLRADQYFVLGDNRQDGVDSIDFGPIQATDILGRVN